MLDITSETTRTDVTDAIEQGSSGWAEGIERPDQEDFEHIYHLYSRRVYSLCLRMARNITEAEDLTQQSFLQAYEKLDTFRGESSFYSWLHRLTVNIVLMGLRKRQVLKEDSLEELRHAGERSNCWQGMEVPSLDRAPFVAIDRVDVERALSQLPSRSRTILIMYDIEGYQHVEISALLGCSIGTSKSQLHRARQRMRKLMREAKWQKSANQ